MATDTDYVARLQRELAEARAENEVLRTKIHELESEVRVDDQLISQRDRFVAQIAAIVGGCEVHGDTCMPHLHEQVRLKFTPAGFYEQLAAAPDEPLQMDSDVPIAEGGGTGVHVNDPAASDHVHDFKGNTQDTPCEQCGHTILQLFGVGSELAEMFRKGKGFEGGTPYCHCNAFDGGCEDNRYRTRELHFIRGSLCRETSRPPPCKEKQCRELAITTKGLCTEHFQEAWDAWEKASPATNDGAKE